VRGGDERFCDFSCGLEFRFGRAEGRGKSWFWGGLGERGGGCGRCWCDKEGGGLFLGL
jgi:hypothetical protein